MQQVCGINLPSDNCVDINEIKLDAELGVASLMGVVISIRDRMKAQYQLTEQLMSLGEPCPYCAHCKIDELLLYRTIEIVYHF